MQSKEMDVEVEAHLLVFEEIGMYDWDGEEDFRVLFDPIAAEFFRGDPVLLLNESYYSDTVGAE
jgi:hypothetical protein